MAFYIFNGSTDEDDDMLVITYFSFDSLPVYSFALLYTFIMQERDIDQPKHRLLSWN